MTLERTCPHGHGALERTPGFWAFQGVNRTGGTLLTEGTFTPNNHGCIVKLWACPVCGLTQAYQDDKEDR